MTRTINVPTPEHLFEIRGELSQDYADAYEAWTRQDLLVDAIRTSSTGPGDETDQAQLKEQVVLANRLRSHLDDLGVAIERTDTGNYGRCTGCGHPIPARRLELFPATIYCPACERQREQR
jgi:RNA polymerase-binding transcription factor DksA